MDNLTVEQRRRNMQRIRAKDTNFEIEIRSELHKRGYRFRKNVSALPGKPDIVFAGIRVAIFLDSCFWHMCPYHSVIPLTNTGYWRSKLTNNRTRDKAVNRKLRAQGWRVLRIWEHEFRKDLGKCVDKIVTVLVEQVQP